MKILLTGGCGYIGTNLTEKLLDENHNVTVVDMMWFGNYLNPHEKLKIIQEIKGFFDRKWSFWILWKTNEES